MELAIVYTRASLGIQAPLVSVEVHINQGLPTFTLVGLPETTVKEAKDRVRCALLNSGFSFPSKRITVNLAPADLPKEGGRFDLPIAIGILAASKQIPMHLISQHEFVAELALSGHLRPITGIIPAALAAMQQQRILILPKDNEHEASLIPQNPHLTATHLLDICSYLHQTNTLSPPISPIHHATPAFNLDLSEIIGQDQGKRALEIAAAGGHNLLLLGPPGTGKTMLANRMVTLIPPLSEQEALESASVHSLSWGDNDKQKNWYSRPFRAPHHTASIAALIGGGNIPKPGEVSLAHHGVLFLDELPEFERRVLDALREPLETRQILISRSAAKICFPANFQLIAAMNPSLHSRYKNINPRTHTQQILRYINRLSSPLLDRFDLSVEIPRLPAGTLSQNNSNGESSTKVRQRVTMARQLQLSRCRKINAHLSAKEVAQWCPITTEDAKFLENTLNKLGLSARTWHSILKVSRTIADLTGNSDITRQHLAEAIGYRYIERLLHHLHMQ